MVAMRVYYFYSKDFPRARASLPPEAEYVSTVGNDVTYWEEIEKRWTAEDDIVFIEHDNVLHENAVQELADCPEPWCSFPYFCGPMLGEWSPWTGEIGKPGWQTKGIFSPIKMVTKSLGCTKFSQLVQCLVTADDLLAENDRFNETYQCPDCVEGTGICWIHIDYIIALCLKDAGFSVHVHNRAIDHLHYKVDES